MRKHACRTDNHAQTLSHRPVASVLKIVSQTEHAPATLLKALAVEKVVVISVHHAFTDMVGKHKSTIRHAAYQSKLKVLRTQQACADVMIASHS